MKLDYARQQKIEEPIEVILKNIGCKCRGRIELLDGDNQVIEFEANDAGKWQHTSWHHKDSDEAFSIFPEFMVDVPAIRDIRARLAR